MNCFYHEREPAVGLCSVCGKALCRRSSVDLGNALACKEGDCTRIVRFKRGEQIGGFWDSIEFLKKVNPRKYNKIQARIWMIRFFLWVVLAAFIALGVYLVHLYYK